MTKDNIARADVVIEHLLKDLQVTKGYSPKATELLTQSILNLEKAKTAGTPKIMNWGAVEINDASDGGEINKYGEWEEKE